MNIQIKILARVQSQNPWFYISTLDIMNIHANLGNRKKKKKEAEPSFGFIKFNHANLRRKFHLIVYP